MTDFDVSDDLRGTVAEKATDFLNSGTINFDVVSADGNSAAALSLIEVHLGDPNLVKSGTLGYSHMNSTGVNGVGTVWTFPDRMSGFTDRARLDKQITNIVHEANHLDEDIDRQRAQISSELSALGVDVSNTRVQVVIEEKLVRDATNIIDELSPGFRAREHYDDINQIISAYGRGQLSNAEKQAIRDYFNSAQYNAPTVELNGKIYGVNVNGNLVEYRNGQEVIVEETPINNHCFLGDSTVQMWPLDPSIKPRADGSYDEELVLSKVWYKRQDQMQAGDIVVSPDKWGRLQPGRVTRTMTNIATHILDFWGTGVTPGHAYNCADGPLKGGFAPLMDILRMDGALMRSDGTMFRSTTNYDVGSMGDMMIHASATMQKPDGTWTDPKAGKVRFGTRIILPDGRHMSFMEMAASEGWRVSDDGYMVGMMKGEDGEIQEQKFHFPYSHGEELPKPEDYILARSDVTLEAIYAAGEWEQIGTRMPAPAGMVGLNTNHTSTLLQPSKPEPNIPPAFADHPDAPRRPQGRTMNRKQRKAMEAKQRKAVKVRKRAAV